MASSAWTFTVCLIVSIVCLALETGAITLSIAFAVSSPVVTSTVLDLQKYFYFITFFFNVIRKLCFYIEFFVTLFSIVTVTVFGSISAVTAELSPRTVKGTSEVPNGNLLSLRPLGNFVCQHLIPCLIECGSHYVNEHLHSSNPET